MRLFRSIHRRNCRGPWSHGGRHKDAAVSRPRTHAIVSPARVGGDEQSWSRRRKNTNRLRRGGRETSVRRLELRSPSAKDLQREDRSPPVSERQARWAVVLAGGDGTRLQS